MYGREAKDVKSHPTGTVRNLRWTCGSSVQERPSLAPTVEIARICSHRFFSFECTKSPGSVRESHLSFAGT